ncbi:5-formyltetrahydrofolate cyclo-ligase [Fructilactobacillus hinvesii]|uniref:5-formyltetrahydrofolate cyclo-ligase n=1 Tax=Fructilactobacillus hinvesii TaxID=2940300 RepID=A0ABY5BSZ9_9LACO|nr:5-formyltetrahydrofolate cyclo-ligase [Fructilactobacillus hinvesii]USS87572.1 5-formyltetrahydrofolate cyclo-ligase [Fructilactobacillus hinvesii]
MKAKIRATVLQKLAEQDVTSQRFRQLYQQLFATSEWQKAQVISVTLSMDHEIPTKPIIEEATRSGKTIVIPRTFPRRRMRFYPFNDSTQLKETRFGVLEPTNGDPISSDHIDLAIVPGVAFCLSNHQRIGYGGGFYDRFLQDFSGATISLAQRDQVVTTSWLADSFDVPIQKLLVEGAHD